MLQSLAHLDATKVFLLFQHLPLICQEKCSLERLGHNIEIDVLGQLCTSPSDVDEHSDTCCGESCIGLLPENVDRSLFLKNMILLYLKLQTKLILPASVIQTVIEGLQDIHDISQSHFLHRLNENLATLGISEDNRKKMADVVKTEDLFPMCNSHVLKTDQRQKSFYKD